MYRNFNFIVALLIVVSLMIVACGSAETPPPPTATPEPPTATPEPPTPTSEPPSPTPEPPTPEPPTPTPEPPSPTPEPPTPEPPTPTSEPPTPTPEPTATPVAETQPAAPALQGRFYFPVYDEADGTYDIYSTKPDGSDRQLVVEEASQPGLRPDGKAMLYRSWTGDNRGLFERDLAAGEDIWQFNVHFESGRPSYSPDEKSYLFQSREAGDEFAVYKTDEVEYDVLRRESKPIRGEAPVWTPDGESFIYKTCIGTRCGLYFTNIDGSSPQQLTEDLSDTNPAVSPDGETIAFMSERTGNWDVYVMDIDGSNLSQLTTDPADDGLPIWSPDGRTIAFVSERDDEWAMWGMNPDGSNRRKLFDLGGSIDGTVSLDVANARGWIEETIDWVQ